MKIKKGFLQDKKGCIIAILMYIALIVLFTYTSDKLDKKLIETKTEVIEVKKEVATVKQQINTTNYIRLKNGDDEQNAVVAYLWHKTHNIDIILTFYGESWLKSSTINNNKLQDGTIWSTDFGYCQLNDKYHKEFINSKEFTDMNKQLDYCIEVYNKAIKSGRIKTTFYAYNHRYSKRIRSQFVISQEAVNLTYNVK